MSEQQPLGVPYQRHSATSRDAAILVSEKPTKIVQDRQKILAMVRRSGPMTDREIQAALEMPGDTERPRRIELVRAGWLIDTGERRDRSTVWGCS